MLGFGAGAFPFAFCATLLSVASEPVKLMAATRASDSSVAPTSEPRPITKLKTPAGKPLRERMLASAQAAPGTRSAGLNTTQLPQASAGAIFRAGMAIGKFQGVMMPTAPTGSRVISTPTPGRTEAMTWPPGRSASPEKT